MAWPKLIELFERKEYISSTGSVVESTFYVEPASAAHAVTFMLTGYCLPKLSAENNDDARAIGFKRRNFPAGDLFRANFFCTEAEIIPLDQEQISYFHTLHYQDAQGPSRGAIFSTLESSVVVSPSTEAAPASGKFEQDVRYKISVDPDRVAGCFIKATYKPLVFLGLVTADSWDYVNPQWIPKARVNEIPSGLRLKVNIGGPLGRWAGAVYWPSASVSPVLNEQYTRFTIQRLFVPDFHAGERRWNSLINGVNSATFSFGGASYAPETVRYMGYDVEMHTGNVLLDEDEGLRQGGDLSFSELAVWYSITHHFDIRVLTHVDVYDDTGNKVPSDQRKDGRAQVTWNHVLAWPGTYSAITSTLAAGDAIRVGWYKCGYTSQAGTIFNPFGKLTPPHPLVDFGPLFQDPGLSLNWENL